MPSGQTAVPFLMRGRQLMEAIRGRLCTFFFGLFFGLFLSGFARAQTVGTEFSAVSVSAGTGFVESAAIDPINRTLTLAGWVAPKASNVFVTNLSIHLNGEEIYRGRFERFERADVVKATGREDWLLSGFRIEVDISGKRELPQSPLKVFARLGSGERFELSLSPTLEKTTSRVMTTLGFWSFAGLWTAALLPALCFAISFLPVGKKHRWDIYFGVSTCFAFLLLVAGGWTGSSLGLALKASPIIEYDAPYWKGQDRTVRSDEWQVLTPLAISQKADAPPFQITNKLLGIDGQNMMVMGMTGVPVAHLSSVAKPATWGFFLFDLRNALSWYWWFAFFACFLAFWLVLIQFLRLDWRMAALLALTAAGSPYSVAYSGWPAYAAFFPLAAVLALRGVLTKKSRWQILGFGVALGWSITGFTLVLYPAWQISLVFLFLPLTLAWAWRERKDLLWGWPQVLGITVGIIIATGLMAAWWFDAESAVASVRATVYPGGRSLEAGGDIDPWFMIKGWLSPVSMYANSALMVPSDASSFIFVIWATLPAMVLRMFVNRRIDWMGCSLIVTAVFILTFMFVGFDKRFAQMTFMGSATSYRMDLVLGLAQTFMLGWLISQSRHSPSKTNHRSQGACAALAIVAVAWASWLFDKLPFAISQTVAPGFLVLAYAGIGLTTWAVLSGRYRSAIGVLAVWTASASIPFNPIGLATDRVTTDATLAKYFAGIDPKDAWPAIAVIGKRDWAMTLPAAGGRVVNTVFYYPQKSLWKSLDPDNQHAAIHNRYHRLLLYFKTLPKGTGHTLESPRLDEVRVFIDPEQFDFRRLGAKAILVAPEDGEKIRASTRLPQLTLLNATPDWELFKVLP